MSNAATEHRPRRRLVVWLLASSFLLVTAAFGSQPSAAASIPHRYGVSFGGVLYDMDARTLDATLADVRATGATWIREQLPWSGLEPVQGQRRWEGFDRVVASARRHHLTLDVLLGGAPVWARSLACPSAGCPPTSVMQFAGYVQAVAKRYRGTAVGAYEIWNEPNVVATWYPRADPSTYALLLRASVLAIRKVDRRVLVISGGLAPAATRRGNMEPRDFLAGLCRSRVLSMVDAVGAHPYSAPAAPDYNADWNAWTQMAGTRRSLQSLMRSCGASGKPIWATEYGGPTGGPGVAVSAKTWRSAPSTGWYVTEQYQAQLISSAVRLTGRSPWLQALFVYTERDRGVAPTTRENFFGLRRYDGSAKPAYGAFKRAVASAGQDRRG